MGFLKKVIKEIERAGKDIGKTGERVGKEIGRTGERVGKELGRAGERTWKELKRMSDGETVEVDGLLFGGEYYYQRLWDVVEMEVEIIGRPITDAGPQKDLYVYNKKDFKEYKLVKYGSVKSPFSFKNVDAYRLEFMLNDKK